MKGKQNKENVDFFYCHCIVMILEGGRREKNGTTNICLERAV